jgi:protein ImuB
MAAQARPRSAPATLPSPPEAPAQPLVLTEAGPRGVRVALANPAAAALGIHAGQRLADARALCPTLASQPIDRAGDAAALARLARWLLRYTPWVALDGADGLLLDCAGCAHLLGGEARLLADIRRRLESHGLTVRLALADTRRAARALARAGDAATVLVPPGRRALVDALQTLPVAALDVPEAMLTLLRRAGLSHIGPLLGLPRAALAKRFRGAEAAQALLRLLDEALGEREHPLDPLEPPPLYEQRALLAEPILERAQIEQALHDLLHQLLPQLSDAELGVRRLAFSMLRVDGGVQTLVLRCGQPSRDPAHLLRLAHDKLEQVAPGFGIDALRLMATEVAPLPPLQLSSLAAPDPALALSRLVDTLSNRLGEAAVRALVPVASHIPERAEQLAAQPAASGTGQDQGAPVRGPRPPLLLPTPEPAEVMAEVPDGPPVQLRWRRQRLRLALSTGADRIGAEWWRSPDDPAPSSRDYYAAETEDGRRLWLLRDGHYGDPAHPPRWYVHGVGG